MSIKPYLHELESLRTEIKRNNKRNSELRKRINQIEMHITSYLKNKEQNGVKYNGQAIVVEDKEDLKFTKLIQSECKRLGNLVSKFEIFGDLGPLVKSNINI